MTAKSCDNQITCTICLQLYQNPKILPCQHSYCEECLIKLEKDEKIACPACRSIADVPSNGVKDFNTNFFIKYQVDDHILRRKLQGKEEVSCEVCVENDPVLTFCPTCVLFMCKLCDDQHKRSRNTCQHVAILLTDAHSKIKDIEVKPKRQVAICKKHALDMKFYCETCEELVCLYCTTKAHSTHSHDSVKEVAAKRRKQLRKTAAQLNDMITKLSQAHDNITDMTESVLQRHRTVGKEIDQFFDNVIQKIEQQRQQLKQELHNKVSGKVKLLTSQLEEVESVQAHVNSVNELVAAVEGSGDEILMLSGERQVVYRVHKVTEAYSKLHTDPVESCVYFFTPFYKSFSKLGYIFNPIPPQCEFSDIPHTVLPGQTVQFTVTTKEVRGAPYISGVVKVQLDNGRGKIESVPVKDSNNGKYTGSFDTKLVGHHQLSVTIGGESIKGSPVHFIVSRDYSKLNRSNKVINNDGKMGKPRGVTISSDHYWAVADSSNHCVYIFDEQNQPVRKIGSHGDGAGQFNGPSGVSFDDDNFLYVVDGLNHRVQKFDRRYYILQFGRKGSNDNELYLPVGITVHHNRVYIADCGNHRISVYQTDGTYCFSFGSQGNGPGQFQHPWDVAVTPNNTLVVANTYGHCIQSFQFDGVFLHKFGTCKGQLSVPSSLAVDCNGFVLVTNCYDHKVSIFDKNCNYVHNFGSRGTGNNRFDQPRSIAVSPNGNIYISDHLNKRVIMY